MGEEDLLWPLASLECAEERASTEMARGGRTEKNWQSNLGAHLKAASSM